MGSIAHPSLVVPKFLAADHTISRIASLVLALLDDYRNKQTGQCNPRVSRLARDLGVCPRTIQRGLAELRRWGLIAVQFCRSFNQYVVAAREEWGKLLAQARIRGRSGPVEKPPDPAPAPKRTEGEQNSGFSTDSAMTNCHPCHDKNVTPEPPHLLLNLLNEPTYQETGDPAAARSVHHAAAATPPVVEILAVEKQLPACGHLLLNGYKPQSPLSVELWQKLVAIHPQPGQPLRALVEIDKFLGRSRNPSADAVKLYGRHAQWREYWATLERGAFIPQLWRWIEERDWMAAPVIRVPRHREFESAGERQDRILKEVSERADRER
jgi:Helix-turn-helix domain